ncbi:LysE/ArgO family amino acid transporter [Rivihabitans pingtungensis]|uniref:L-lysine exporter family protein LysE/ArgO n=2 Tax=Rivihabitans pingtungensis TaxID=1054498 RepID=A0A318KUW1_9NEIS|nr:LysE/ArgO family amino acid transporter [Rivihabitans pingtungensis]PXX77013.1 L-lysine exporter family protein LysE/ArgO [Rivihabitans pingtungensis]
MQSAVFFQGLAVSAGLIVAIGAQNAFVLAQGVRGAHRLQIALACASSDALLIALGVGGAGALIASQPALLALARWGGAAFLLVYAAMALRRAWHGESMTLPADSQQSVWRVLLATLAVTWLNPHVYLDTVVLLGGVAAQLPAQERFTFGLGAALASWLWFFALAYGARLLAPLFTRPASWRVLDTSVALVMLAVAYQLLQG